MVCIIALSACKHQRKQDVVVEQSSDTSAVESVDTTTKKTLNDIRFAGWKYEDWLDNEYIRELRLYINDYLSGEIENAELDEYRENIKGKFAIVNIVPFIMGGAQIYREALSVVDRMYITHVERDYEGDTVFPDIDYSQWKLVDVVRHERGEEYEYPFEFRTYDRA